VAWSILRIGAGFVVGVVLAAAGALLSSRFGLFDAVFSPFVRVVRATPVASVIILAWVWFGGKLVPALAVGLMVLPVVYEQTLAGIRAIDPQLLEMSRLYRLSTLKRVKYVVLPSVRPYFISAMMTALGLGWKAGVAAEVIAHPVDALGTGIYESKIYLEMPDLFAYTVTVVAISVLLEKLIRFVAEGRKSRGRN
jgi:NitT/TauT family transport system permease protein